VFKGPTSKADRREMDRKGKGEEERRGKGEGKLEFPHLLNYTLTTDEW